MNRSAVLALALFVLLVTAGCLNAETVSERAETPTEFFHPKSQPHDQSTRQPVNPWGEAQIDVVVDELPGSDGDVNPLVMEALYYWEERPNAGDYRHEYRLWSETDDPDIRIEVVPAIDSCGVHESGVTLGCAPVLSASERTNGTVTVRVRADRDDEVTLAVLKHELGHTLGLRHGEGPGTVMNETMLANAPASVTDASHRRYPWSSRTLHVAFAAGDSPDADARERVRHAMRYYERGGGGVVPFPPAFEFVDDPSRAEVVVDLNESLSSCPTIGPGSSCAYWDGPSVDDDPAPEYYTHVRVVVAGEARERVGWHFGYWLGHSLWVGDVPPPFRVGTHSARSW